MTRAELYNNKWRIVKRHFDTHEIVAISEGDFKSRALATNAYRQHWAKARNFIRVKQES